MLSKNNFSERLRKMDAKKERFSIRKLSIGAASILIGLTFIGMSNQTAKAATIENAQTENTIESGDAKADIDSKDNKTEETNDVENRVEGQNEETAQLQIERTEKPTVGLEEQKVQASVKTAADKTQLTSADSTAKPEENKRVAPAKEQNVKSYAGTEIDVYGPANNRDDANSEKHDGQSNYYVQSSKVDITGKKDANGKTSWNSVTIPQQSLTDILKGNNFTDPATGMRGNSLPDWEKDGYVPVITDAQVAGEDIDNLFGKVNGWIKQHHTATELPSFVTNSPVTIDYNIHYYKAIHSRTTEEVNIYLPGNDNDTTSKNSGKADYYTTVIAKDMSGYQDDNGNKVWTSVSVDPVSVASILSGNNFTNNSNGHRGYSLPVDKIKGYIPVVTSVKTSYNHDYRAEGDRLFYQLRDNLNENPNLDELPAYTVSAPVSAVYNIHFVKWVKTGQSETFTRTVRTWYQYKVGGENYTYTYRQGTAPVGIQEKKYTVTLDQYKNAEGDTQWRVNPSESSNMDDLTADLQIPAVKGYTINIDWNNSATDESFDKPLKVNNGKEDGREISKIFGRDNFDPRVGNEFSDKQGNVAEPAFITEKDGIYNQNSKLNNQTIDIFYVANLHKITVETVDQDTGKVVTVMAPSSYVASDWSWFEGAGIPVPKGYHVGTKQGNPIPNYDFATGKFIVNGKVVNGVDIPMGTEDITYVYYVKKDAPAQPTKPQTSNPKADPQPSSPTSDPTQPEVPAEPENPAQTSNGQEVAPVLPEETRDKNTHKDKKTTTVTPHAQTEKKAAKRDAAPVHKVGRAAVKPMAIKAEKHAAKAVNAPAKSEAKTLPQTGEKANKAGIAGLAILALSFLGLAGADEKRKEDK